MPSIQLFHWSLWGLSLLAGVGAILALFKLRYAERFLPHWSELKELEAILPVRREELRQTSEGIDKCRAEIGQLEATVGHLRILKEWQDANPEAPARIQQMMMDLERCKSELAALQQKLAEDEAKRNTITREVSEFAQKKAELDGQIPILRDRLAALHKEDTSTRRSPPWRVTRTTRRPGLTRSLSKKKKQNWRWQRRVGNVTRPGPTAKRQKRN
jgi:hypothetical protein